MITAIWNRFFASSACPKCTGSHEFLPFIEKITERLRANGFAREANRINEMMHEMVWTTATELLVNLAAILRRSLNRPLPSDLSRDIRAALKTIKRSLRLC